MKQAVVKTVQLHISTLQSLLNILDPPPQHQQPCVLLQLYHRNPHCVEGGLRSARLLILLFAHKALTLRNRPVLFLRKRMTSNSPRLPSGGKLKLLWKGTDLKSLCDKHALAYFLVLIYLLVAVGLWEGFCTLFELTDQTLGPQGIVCSILCRRWKSILPWLFE